VSAPLDTPQAVIDATLALKAAVSAACEDGWRGICVTVWASGMPAIQGCGRLAHPGHVADDGTVFTEQAEQGIRYVASEKAKEAS